MLEFFLDKIFNEDAISFLKKIPDNSIDVTFVDPPFNLNKPYSSYKDDKTESEYLNWSKNWLLEMIRITKPKGSIFVHNIPKWLLEYYRILFNDKNDIRNPYYEHLKNLKFIDWIVWNEAGSPKGKYLYASHYGILWLSKSSKPKYYNIRIPHKFCRVCNSLLKDYGGKKNQINEFGTILSDVWDDIHRYKHSKRRDGHPNQLPVPLLERILLMTTDPGDVVLDPMCGVGTTCIAAKKLGLHYIGNDKDEHYCEIARNKLAETTETKIGDVYVSIFIDKVMSVKNKDVPKILEYLEHVPIYIRKDKYRYISNGRVINFNNKNLFKFLNISIDNIYDKS
ncbi:MAG: DNA-methyltransferase [Thermoplasmata archaeon]|jgi:site-specific DNA-methyltransferase (adenine-specific)